LTALLYHILSCGGAKVPFWPEVFGQKFDNALFAEALKATAAHRGTTEQISDIHIILINIEESPELRVMWDKYRKQFAYADEIEYVDITKNIKDRVYDHNPFGRNNK
jgi:hypothetical protein